MNRANVIIDIKKFKSYRYLWHNRTIIFNRTKIVSRSILILSKKYEAKYAKYLAKI